MQCQGHWGKNAELIRSQFCTCVYNMCRWYVHGFMDEQQHSLPVNTKENPFEQSPLSTWNTVSVKRLCSDCTYAPVQFAVWKLLNNYKPNKQSNLWPFALKLKIGAKVKDPRLAYNKLNLSASCVFLHTQCPHITYQWDQTPPFSSDTWWNSPLVTQPDHGPSSPHGRQFPQCQ